jgi:hypothetical protein
VFLKHSNRSPVLLLQIVQVSHISRDACLCPPFWAALRALQYLSFAPFLSVLIPPLFLLSFLFIPKLSSHDVHLLLCYALQTEVDYEVLS